MKKVLLISLMLLTVFMMACTGGETTIPYDPFVGGNDGVVMTFVEGMPPMEEGAVLDNGKSSFSVGLKITNVGEHDIEEDDFLDLRLRGILPEQFGVTYDDLIKQLEDPLPGAKKNIDGTTLPGQFTTMSFDDLSYLPDAQGDIPKTFVIDLCYDYSTKSSTPICVAGDVTGAITNKKDKEICLVNGEKIPKNSGGPVQVTEFKEQPQGGNKVSVLFTVSHVGTDGKIFKYEGDDDNPCDDSLTNQAEKDEVKLHVYLPDQTSATIECNGDFDDGGSETTGYVKLFEGNPRTVTCTITESTNNADVIYEDLLAIDMYYRYGQTAKTTVIIKDLGSANED